MIPYTHRTMYYFAYIIHCSCSCSRSLLWNSFSQCSTLCFCLLVMLALSSGSSVTLKLKDARPRVASLPANTAYGPPGTRNNKVYNRTMQLPYSFCLCLLMILKNLLSLSLGSQTSMQFLGNVKYNVTIACTAAIR